MITLPPPLTLMRNIVDSLARRSATRAQMAKEMDANPYDLSKPLLRLLDRGIISTDGQRPATYSLTPACLLALGNGEARAA